MIEEEESVFAHYTGGPSGLKLSFAQEPVDIVASGDFIFTKINILKNGQELDMRYAQFTEYTNDNGITFTLDSDIGEIKLYARIVEKDTNNNNNTNNNGKLHLVHNYPDYERVLTAHENECSLCYEYKPCLKSSYHSISLSSEKNELMLYLQLYLSSPSPQQKTQYHLLVSTADRSAFVLSPPFKIVQELTLSNNNIRKKLIVRQLQWLVDFLGAMLPDDDNAEDCWVAFDNAVEHKLRNFGGEDAPALPLDDLEKLLIPLLNAIGQAQLGSAFSTNKQYFNGWTIIHFACALGFTSVIKLFPKADYEILDMDGHPAMYYATLWGYTLLEGVMQQLQHEKLAKLRPPPVPPPPTPRSKYFNPPKIPNGPNSGHSGPNSSNVNGPNVLNGSGTPKMYP